MSVSEWNKLRSWNGTVNLAFEELCCQLASIEKMPTGSKFIRKGAKDGGIECYWKESDNSETCWQAKFFLKSPDTSQWSQIDESVSKAIEKHPNLKKYIICMPNNKSGSVTDKENSFMKLWEKHVETWCGWATEKGLTVDFDFWGDTEIWNRLITEDNRGRVYFWFNEQFFSKQWFVDRIKNELPNAGPRYSPKINIELDFDNMFEGLGRTSSFYNEIKSLFGNLESAFGKISKTISQYQELEETIKPLLSDLKQISNLYNEKFNWSLIKILSENANKKLLKIIDDYYKKTEVGKVSSVIKQLEKLENITYDILIFSRTISAILFDKPFLLITGDAGVGKTHLLCDVADKRVKNDHPTILIFGYNLNQDDPWNQIITNLGLNCPRDEFLGALNTAAELYNSRTLIIIDALNEGNARSIWKNRLAGMVSVLLKYPRIGLVVSTRIDYEDLVIPENLCPDKMTRFQHRGFGDKTYDATRQFFEYYKIQPPSTPLLLPEFQNPQFLKLFCKGQQDTGPTKTIPEKIGFFKIYENFLEHVNKKISEPKLVNFDSKNKIVQKSVSRLAELMAESKKRWIPYDLAQREVNKILPREGSDNSLFRHLISEDVIFSFGVWEDKTKKERIHFAYEQFSDYLIANHLLEKFFDPENPTELFQKIPQLSEIIKDEITIQENRGIIDAFSIILPEKYGRELLEIIPQCKNYFAIKQSLIKSLIWRTSESINEFTKKIIEERILADKITTVDFLDTVILLSSNPHHPYNADFLHKRLFGQELANRDADWSIFIHKQFLEEGSSVDRLIHWAWDSKNTDLISNESARLAGITLAWFLTSSNRFLRDRATKALVSLFTKRIDILQKIILDFLPVNDPYVLERLIATAYGCVTRSSNNEIIGKLAINIYDWFFKNGKPPPHILMRDYARGIIEFAIYKGIDLQIDASKIRPPYNSEWIATFPTDEEIKKYYNCKKNMSDDEISQLRLYSSVMNNDFARYILGTNDNSFDWSSLRLIEPEKIPRITIFESFIKSLSEKENNLWNKYETAKENIPNYKIMNKEKRLKYFKKEYTDIEFDDVLAECKTDFITSLTNKKQEIFKNKVLPNMKYLDNALDAKYNFNIKQIQNWILNKVFDLGWTVKRFGKYDSDISKNYGREDHKLERIGKKYQWLAYHEILARISDNFEFKNGFSFSRLGEYEGSWQTYYRDIDPTILLRKIEKSNLSDNIWWQNTKYPLSETLESNLDWLKNTNDLPNFKNMIEVTNPKDESKWLVLHTNYDFKEPIPPEKKEEDLPKKILWFHLRSYIVKKSDLKAGYKWAEMQNSSSNRRSEPSLSNVFLGEYCWSPAFNYQNIPYHNHDGWNCNKEETIPAKILATSDNYSWGKEYDGSIENTIDLQLLANELVDELKLNWDGVEGCFYDKDRELIAFDPSGICSKPSALLIKRDVFLNYLDAKDYSIIWTMIGEKQIFQPNFDIDEYLGHMSINGVFQLDDEKKLIESLSPKFIPPPGKK